MDDEEEPELPGQEQPPQTSEPPVSEAEAIEQMKKMGMIQDTKPDEPGPNESGPSEKEQKLADAKLLNQFAATIALFKTRAETMEWYEKNRAEFRKTYSKHIYAEITKIVNDKLSKL